MASYYEMVREAIIGVKEPFSITTLCEKLSSEHNLNDHNIVQGILDELCELGYFEMKEMPTGEWAFVPEGYDIEAEKTAADVNKDSDFDTITVMVDKETAEQAEKIFEEFGMNLDSALKLFLKQTVRQGGLPFTTIR